MVDTGSKNYLTIALEEVAAGQDQVPLPLGRRLVARILLGVSGGIAAYKAVELVRLATQGRPRRARRPDAGEPALRRPRLVRGHHRRARAGRRVRARPRARRLPGRARARPRPDHPPRARAPRRRASASRRRRRTRSPSWPTGSPTTCSRRAALACTAPLVRRAGDEQPHVRAPGHAGEPRAAARARRHDRRPRHRRARVEGRVGGRPPGRAAEHPGRRRGRCSAHGTRARSTACACSSPPAARASRSTPCATSATARRAGWASRSPRRRRGAAPT